MVVSLSLKGYVRVREPQKARTRTHTHTHMHTVDRVPRVGYPKMGLNQVLLWG